MSLIQICPGLSMQLCFVSWENNESFCFCTKSHSLGNDKHNKERQRCGQGAESWEESPITKIVLAMACLHMYGRMKWLKLQLKESLGNIRVLHWWLLKLPAFSCHCASLLVLHKYPYPPYDNHSPPSQFCHFHPTL